MTSRSTPADRSREGSDAAIGLALFCCLALASCSPVGLLETAPTLAVDNEIHSSNVTVTFPIALRPSP